MGFPTKNYHFGVFWGKPPFKETPIWLHPKVGGFCSNLEEVLRPGRNPRPCAAWESADFVGESVCKHQCE